MTFPEFLAVQQFPITLKIRVTPSAALTEIRGLMADGETWKIRVAAVPEKGRANNEIVHFLEKTFGCRAEIVGGESSKAKLVRLSHS